MDQSPSVTLFVPRPPSANRIWSYRGVGKRPTKSDAYKTWLTTAGWEIKRQFVGGMRIDGRFDVSIEVPISQRDTDNWTKPLLDLCQATHVVSNDGNMNQVTIVPAQRDDCVIRITERPDLGGVRKAAKSPWEGGTIKKKRASSAAVARSVRQRGMGL